jgi:pimeloyl-ACP methyl ester carboxylesterase
MHRIWGFFAAGVLLATTTHAEEAAGIWRGKLMGQLTIIVRIEKEGQGYKGTLQSPDQSKALLPLDTISATADTLSFDLKRINGHYEGHWDDAQKAWVGTWSQGQSLPLSLSRINESDLSVSHRPQVDAAEAALAQYHVESVQIATPTPGVTLAGTYSAPKGNGPFPAVVLIAGSGPNTRDETVAGHKVFLVLADALNRAGIAVLRYDKRGIGGSTGAYAQATTADFADDAQAAAHWLGARKDVKTIGLIGHSEGGIIAPLVANRTPKVQFVGLLAGSAVRGDHLLLSQQVLIGRANGMDEAALSRAQATNRKIYDAIIADPAHAETTLRAIVAAEWPAGTPADPAVIDAIVKPVTSPWMSWFLRYDPQVELKKLKIPVLALTGEKDLQVAARDNLPVMKAALAGNPDATLRELPGLNHLFQTAGTGAPSEYGDIEETFAPSALKIVTDWVSERTR